MAYATLWRVVKKDQQLGEETAKENTIIQLVAHTSWRLEEMIAKVYNWNGKPELLGFCKTELGNHDPLHDYTQKIERYYSIGSNCYFTRPDTDRNLLILDFRGDSAEKSAEKLMKKEKFYRI